MSASNWSLKIAGLVAALALTTMQNANANATLALDLTTGGTSTACGGGCGSGDTIGYEFTVTSTVSGNALGAWNAGGTGLGSAPEEVGIWSTAGSLVTSATVTSASTPVASASTDGDWLFTSVSPFVLTPGTYDIGLVFFATSPLSQIGASFVTEPGITVDSGTVSGNAGFSQPTDPFFTDIFGPTFGTISVPAPEPASLAILGAALTALAGLRRRRAQRG